MKRYADRTYRILGEAAFEVLAKAKELERQGSEILHFEIGEPDMDTPAFITGAAKEALDQGHTHYVPSGGTLELKQAIQDEIEATRGFRPDLDQILVLPGLKPGIFFSVTALAQPGDEVIFQDPAYPTYGSLTAYTGATPMPIPLLEENEFRMSPDDIKERITEKTKLIIINSPQNPTGSVLKRSEVEEIAEMAEEHDIFLVSDEIYSKMLYNGEEHHSACVRDECRERSILLDGFSKAYAMTGWRLGYAIAPKQLVEKFTLMAINAISCTTSFVQDAGVTALRGNQDFITDMMDKFTARRDAVVKGLNAIEGVSCIYPKGAFYAFPNITGTGMTSDQVADKILKEAGVALLPGTAFGPSGEGYLRLSYATDMDTIQRAMLKMKEVLE